MAVRVDRLLRLADFLDGLDPKRFDFRTWVGKGWQGAPDLSCGTTACALGWACTLPDMGLQLDPESCNNRRLDGRPDVTMNGTYPLRAASEVFGISDNEAEYLFLPYNNGGGKCGSAATPKEVAAQIRGFVEWTNAGNTGRPDGEE